LSPGGRLAIIRRRSGASRPAPTRRGGCEMGKGDRRTRRGKIWRGTYGNARPRKPKKKQPEGKGQS